jgi:hypothetical protein
VQSPAAVVSALSWHSGQWSVSSLRQMAHVSVLPEQKKPSRTRANGYKRKPAAKNTPHTPPLYVHSAMAFHLRSLTRESASSSCATVQTNHDVVQKKPTHNAARGTI